MEIKFTVPGPPKGKQRPRICRVNGRSMAYTPKGTIEYEKLEGQVIQPFLKRNSKGIYRWKSVYLPFILFRNTSARKQKN